MTKKIDTPNYTQIPNALLGDVAKGNKANPGLMASLEGSQLKVFLAVCRLTFGFHQVERRASLTMIQQFTGLSRQGVINASNELEELNLIERMQDGGVTLWRVVVNSVDQVVNSVDQGSQLSRPPSKKETKKKTKEIHEKWSKIQTSYQQNITLGISPITAQEMQQPEYFNLPLSWWQEAVKIAADNNKRAWSYVRGVLDRSIEVGLSPKEAGPPGQKSNGRQPAASRNEDGSYNV